MILDDLGIAALKEENDYVASRRILDTTRDLSEFCVKCISSLFQRLCKPPNWCKIKTLVWRFYYVKKKDEPRGKSKKGKAP